VLIVVLHSVSLGKLLPEPGLTFDYIGLDYINYVKMFFFFSLGTVILRSKLIYLQSSDHHMRGSARPQLNYKLIIGWQCRQEMGKIPNFTDSEWLKTLRTIDIRVQYVDSNIYVKTDCVLKIYKDKKFYQLGLQVCWP